MSWGNRDSLQVANIMTQFGWQLGDALVFLQENGALLEELYELAFHDGYTEAERDYYEDL